MAGPLDYKSLIAPLMVMVGTGLGVAFSGGMGMGVLGTIFAAILGGGGALALAFGAQKWMGDSVDVENTTPATIQQAARKEQSNSNAIVVAESGLDIGSRATSAADIAKKNGAMLLDTINQAENKLAAIKDADAREKIRNNLTPPSRSDLADKITQYDEFAITLSATPLTDAIRNKKQLTELSNHEFFSQVEPVIQNRMTAIVNELKDTRGQNTGYTTSGYSDAEFVDKSITQGLASFKIGDIDEMDRLSYGSKSKHITIGSTAADTPGNFLGGALIMHPLRHLSTAVSLGGIEAIPVFGLHGYATAQDASVDSKVRDHASLFLELNELAKLHRELIQSKAVCANNCISALKEGGVLNTSTSAPAPQPTPAAEAAAAPPTPDDQAAPVSKFSIPEAVRKNLQENVTLPNSAAANTLPFNIDVVRTV